MLVRYWVYSPSTGWMPTNGMMADFMKRSIEHSPQDYEGWKVVYQMITQPIYL